MGIFRRIYAKWKAASTTEKIDMAIDFVCSVGSTIIGTDAGRRLSAGHGKVSSAIIRVTTFGGSIAAGNIAAKALQENYGDVLGHAIDTAKTRLNEKKEEEKA